MVARFLAELRCTEYPDSCKFIPMVLPAQRLEITPQQSSLAFQRSPAHTKIMGNKIADALAPDPHQMDVPTISSLPHNKTRRLIRDLYLKHHPSHQSVADKLLAPAIPRVVARAAASLVHRLRANCTNTRSNLHELGRVCTSTRKYCG